MANAFFILGNFIVFIIIIKMTMQGIKIDNLFCMAVTTLTIGTLCTGSFMGVSMLGHINASVMLTECCMLLYNRIRFRKVKASE